MAEKLASLHKKGGGLTETVLWTNSTPTGNFNAQTVTISEDMNNFDYIKIVFRTETTNSDVLTVIHPVNEFVNTAYTDTKLSGGISYNGSSAKWGRTYYYVSDTQIGFTTGNRYNTSGTSAAICIPVTISGLK